MNSRGEFSARTSQRKACLRKRFISGIAFDRVCRFMVTQPRMPCFKLGIRFNRSDMVKRFLQSGRTGFYFAVLKEGEVAAGDSIELLERDEHKIPVADVVNLYRGDASESGAVASRQRTTLTSKQLARLLS